jgi:non-reducing end alpha-L-arabinofuranosidase
MNATPVLRPLLTVAVSSLVLSAVVSACSTAEPGDDTPGAGGSTSGTTGGGKSGSGGSVAGTSTGGKSGASGSGGSVSPAGGTAGTTGGTPPVGGGGSGNQSGSGGTPPIGGGAGVSGSAGASPTGGAGSGAGGGQAGTDSAGGSSGGGAGGATGGAGGGASGSGGSGGSMASMGPCDIYAAAAEPTPCVAAYSPVRRLSSTYTGPLYQLRRGGPDPNTGSGGETQDIGQLPNGFADVTAHEAFCGSMTCTFSVIYDQSGRENNLTVAKRGCYEGTAAEDDYESDAKRRPTMVGGNEVYALYMDKHEGYRNNEADGMPTGSMPQGIYSVAEGSGKRPGAGCCCCWNFGNASTNNCYGPTGQMNALYLGTGYWGKGAGSGPWFMGDFEAGVWAGGSGPSNATNSMSPSMTMDYAFGILKTRAGNYAIRTANAQTGDLNTNYDGAAPATWTMEGGIILGIGGDNSNSSDGTFLEGVITAGRPADETDLAVLRNVQAAGYGM